MHNRPAIPQAQSLAIALALVATLQAPATPGNALSDEQHAGISAAVEKGMEDAGIPGLSIAVTLRGKVVYAEGFGMADREESVPASADTVYRTASLAKPITAVAAMQLAERGQLDLDAPVQEYCPGFPEKKSPITTRQLLGHLSGIRHNKENEVKLNRHFADINEALTLFRDDKLEHRPGMKFGYSTHGYTLVGCVIEGASGRSFMDYLSENVFQPAEMDRTDRDDIHNPIPGRARGYRKLRGKTEASLLVDTSYKLPGGGLVSTVGDMARFANAVLDDTLLGRESRETMWTNLTLGDGEPSPWALGWQVIRGTQSKRLYALHTGQQPEVSTILVVVPEQRYAVVIMANLERQASTALVSIANQVHEIVLEP